MNRLSVEGKDSPYGDGWFNEENDDPTIHFVKSQRSFDNNNHQEVQREKFGVNKVLKTTGYEANSIESLKEKMEGMKTTYSEHLRSVEDAHQKQVGNLVTDIEKLVKAVEERDLRVLEMSRSIEDADMLRSEIERLRTDYITQKQQLEDITRVARDSRTIVKQVEEESFKVLQQNQLLKFRINELTFVDNHGGVGGVYQIQPHPSECDLQLEEYAEEEDEQRENEKLLAKSVAGIILPDKFDFEKILASRIRS